MAMAILAALAVTLAAALPGVSADGGDDKAAPIPRSGGTSGDNQAPPIPEKAELSYTNLGSHLDQLAASVEAGQATAQVAASNSPVHSGESVAVTIYLTGNVEEVVSFLEDNGGDPRNVGEDYIEAYVPVTLLGPVSERPGVIRVREIVPPLPAQGVQRVDEHGPAAHLSAAWNQAGYSGQGVKVGIIDVGFKGFSGLMGTELPATVRARCYTDLGRFTTDLEDCETGRADDTHGTAVAESLLDIAPQVDLYIGHPVSRGDLQAIADWMVSEGVSVINYSAARPFDGPGDGTSPLSISPLRTVDRAVTGGAVWVNSAGNYARTTWFARAPFLDQDRNGIIEFAPGDEINGMTLAAGGHITVQLRWDGSWGGARTNLNIGLLNFDTRQLVEFSLDPQSGGPGHIPFEFLVYTVPVDGSYGVAVGHASGSVPDWIQLMVWDVRSIEHYTKNGSIVNPSESANPGMLTVGAAHWDDVRAIGPDSSRGSTPDGRIKPDIVGVECGATALSPLNDYSEGFCGTSQASPHVAGMAALVRQRFPSYTPAQVASYLKDNAEQRQSPDPNSTWGHGFAQLPPPDGTAPPVPAPSNVVPRNPAADFNTLADAFNRMPYGIWSDGETMWVSDWEDGKIYAYDMATKVRGSGKDFDTLEAAENTSPVGIWSDGETMWVADVFDGKIYAYDMATKARVADKDFNTLQTAENTGPVGIWSDGETMWVADVFDGKIYAYDTATKARVSGKDFNTLKATRNVASQGIWSDGMTMWVSDSVNDKVYAYDMATRARVPGREFNTLDGAGNWIPTGLWSDGTTMWVADWEDDKIYAYPMPQSESAADRDALVALYNATGGADWTNNTNWLTNAPMGQWYGVTTDSQGRVTKLNLTSNQLKGAIPPELANLTNLELLALGGNELTGTIPTWLGNLTKLEELYLWGNELTGTIPSELASLTSLEILELGDNQLTGTIPPWLGSLTKLKRLHLWGNELIGTIPSELGSLTKLQQLSLSDNQLTGTIPIWLGTLTKLEDLRLWGNELSGEIPTQLGSLTNLEQLHLNSNQLTGEIPAELGRLSNLELLSLSRNQLTGQIPAELGSLANLVELWLPDNQFTGEIPVELGSVSNLVELVLWGNELTGEIPAELGSLSNLEVLSLSSNQLSGTIPEELGNLTNLEELYLWRNQLSGTVPQTLVGLTMLESFVFHYNPGLCAPIDDAFQTWLRGISTVLGSSCAPTDSPEDRAVLVQVHSATDGANWTNNTNWLSEHLTREWYGVTTDANGRVHGLFLGSNQLTGEIPAELGRLTNLTVLRLAGNQLTGCVPAALRDVEDNDFAQLGLPFCETPAASEHSATRSFSATTVAPGGEITVNIALSEYGRGGSVAETLPEGFTLVSGSIELVGGGGLASPSGNQVRVVLAGAGVTNVIYKVTAPSEAGGPHAFTGKFVNFDGKSVDIGGASTVTVAAVAGTPASYDSNGNGIIELPELFVAIDDYFAGKISLTVLFEIIDFYFSGNRVG